MKWLRLPVLATSVVVSSTPVQAIDFGLGLFKKKEKPAESTAVKSTGPATTLRTDPDESRRKAAAEEARALDPRSHPDLIPALVQALQNDPSPAVRGAAADTIGRLKPTQPLAGSALESAQVNDPSPLVREASRNALWQYHLNGYRPLPAAPVANATQEPPLATKGNTAEPTTTRPSKVPTGLLTSKPSQTVPVSTVPNPAIPRPMPTASPEVKPTPLTLPVVPTNPVEVKPAQPVFTIPTYTPAPPVPASPMPAPGGLTLPPVPTIPLPTPMTTPGTSF